MSSPFDITVVGAGMTGLAFAALLAKGGAGKRVSIRVVDAGPRPHAADEDDISLRVSAVANGSAELLSSVGSWQKLPIERVSPYDGMRVWDENDAADSGTALHFDAAEFAVPQLGYIVENIRIRQALLEVLDETDVDLCFESPIEDLPPADLVVGADGARSRVRDLAGIAANQWPYDQTAFVTHLQPQQDHGGVAWQRFLRSGPIGMLPLADGRISIVWSTDPDDAGEALDLPDAELGRRLTEVSDYVLGDLTVAGPRGAFPLSARHAEKYVDRGVALIGDAAHAIHPLAGQGANLGLQDASKLAQTLEAAIMDGLHPGDRPVLRRYERARKGANLTMLHFMTGLNRLFATDSGLVGEIRSAGMRLFNRSGPIRERAVKVALGVR